MLMWVQKRIICEKDYIWNSATYSCKIFRTIIDDSVTMCDEIFDAEAKRFDEKNKNS